MELGPVEIVLILVIVLLIFGPGKLPQAAASVGKALKAFRDGQKLEPDADEKPGVKPARRFRRKSTKKLASGLETEAMPARPTAPTPEVIKEERASEHIPVHAANN